MRIEYGVVTSVYSDPAGGGQLCHVKSNISNREYRDCEILATRGVHGQLKAGDVVAVSEIHNGETVVLGFLEQNDLGLAEGEIEMINPTGTAVIKMTPAGKVTITFPSGVITLDTDGSIKLAGAKLGLFTAAPVTQPGAITDADGSLGSVNSKLNSLLAAARLLGIIAP